MNSANLKTMRNEDERKILTAKAVLLRVRRELARRLIKNFVLWMMPEFEVSAHHEVLFAEAQMIVDCVRDRKPYRGTISLPPRHTKSLIFSVFLPALLLGIRPELKIIHASYAASLSNGFSLRVRSMVGSDQRYNRLFPGTQLSKERQRIDDWMTSAGGKFKSVGVGGGITGEGADIAILDDIVKEGDEQSPATLESHWQWFASALQTRLSPGASIVIPMTRWSPLDIVGRIKANAASGGDAEQWRHLVLPALALENDPLGRKPGEALWPSWFSRKRLLALRSLSARLFDALFQQMPRSSETIMFKKEDFVRFDRRIDYANQIWSFDLSLGETETSDYIAFARYALQQQRLYVTNIRRVRKNWPEMKRLIIRMMRVFGDDLFVFPKHTYELMAAQELRQEKGGERVRQVAMKGDKRERAMPLSDWVENQRVCVQVGRRGDVFIDEHCQFPDGQFDDQVDHSAVAAHHFGIGEMFAAAILNEDGEVKPYDDETMRMLKEAGVNVYANSA